MISFRLIIAVIAISLSLSSFASDAQYDADLTKKIEKVILEVQLIKPGMSRADLLKVFTTEGGISTRKQRRYVHLKCPNIKVDVQFKPVGNENDSLRESAADKIIRISQPFLEFGITD